MLTSRQRANLRCSANRLDTIFQIGKGGIEETLLRQIAEALTARELIKLRVLNTSAYSAREAGDLAARATDSELVQVIGSRFVLYKQNIKKNQYAQCL